MEPITSKILPAPSNLRQYVRHIRVAEYTGEKEVSIKVCPNGIPGIVFQESRGESAIKYIATSSGRMASVPILFLYGHITELSVMYFKKGPFTTIQVLLQPYALKTLFSIDAPRLTNGSMQLNTFSEQLDSQLLAAKDIKERVDLLLNFLTHRLEHAIPHDTLIEKSLDIIQTNINSISVRSLLDQQHISERQFEKRFVRTIGVSPQFYIRVRRFNEAIRLMNTGQFETLNDVAQALNFHDQSHFIHDIKTFSGITPKSISQKVNDFHYDEVGSSYLE